MTTLNLYSNHQGRDLTTLHVERHLPDRDLERNDNSNTNSHNELDNRGGEMLVDNLAAPLLDGFHHYSRGLAATQELCEMGQQQQRPMIQASDFILHVGCGLGETSRFLASRYSARVVGIDLTEEFVSVGRVLTAKAGLQDMVKLIRGNVLRIPLADETFDAILVEHLEMNITDKALFYKEMARVLKPAGRVLFHDVYLGSDATEVSTPVVDNAGAEAYSNLVKFETIRHAAAAAGLYVAQCRDATQETEEFLQSLAKRYHNSSSTNETLGINDEIAAMKLQKRIDNLSARRIVVKMGIFTKLEEHLP